MSLRVVLVAVFFVAVAASAGAGEHVRGVEDPIPDRIDASEGPSAPPTWVALDAVAPGGSLRHGILSAPAFADLERSLQFIQRLPPPEAGGNAGGVVAGAWPPCKLWTTTHEERLAGRPETIEQLVAASETILRGTVIAAKPGFLHGRLGTVLAVESAKHIKSSASRAVPSILLVFVRDAQVQLNGEWFCVGEETSPARPAAGAEAVLFLNPDTLKKPDRVHDLGSDGLWLQADRRLVIPRQFSRQLEGLGALSLDALEQAMARFIVGGDEP